MTSQERLEILMPFSFPDEFRIGKTQLCHTLCVTSQLGYDLCGGQGKVLYIDTEGNFRPERIKSIATRFSLEPEGVLENIIVARCMTHEQQVNHIWLLCFSQKYIG